MMPERMAKTPASEQVKETIGSGPFRFRPDEWASGAHAGYARFDGYVPRQEPPSFYAGSTNTLAGAGWWWLGQFAAD
jgi:peptide/nickel transport system substrate-binding protein